MKKKYIKAIGLALVCIIAVFLVWNLIDCATLYAKGQTAEVSFFDSWRLRLSLLMEETGSTGHGCEFSRDYAVEMGSLTFCFAQDDCSAIYIPELNSYYTISKENHTALRGLLSRYEPESFI